MVSLPEAARPGPDLHVVSPFDSLTVWSAVAAAAEEPCLVLDGQGTVVGVSESAAELLTRSAPEHLVGRQLSEGPVELVDFTPEVARLSDREVRRTPPMVALRTQSLARGLMRVRLPRGVLRTVDAVSTPLVEGDEVVGSMSFLAAV
jgi:PAS domain-containing protein